MNRRKFLFASGTTILTGIGINSIQRSAVGLNFQISKPSSNTDPTTIDTFLINFDTLELFPQYLDENETLKVTVLLETEEGSKSEKKMININFTNGEKISLDNANISTILIDGFNTDKSYITGKVKVILEHPDISQESYKQSFTIPDENVIFLDDYQGSKGTTIGSDYLISQGIRKSRNTDNNTFTFQENGGSSMNMKHDGSGSDNTFGEIALDINSLSNNEWELNMYGQSWSYNSQQNNYRIGVVDKKNRDNFCEFMETETSGVNPRVAGNNVNSSYTSNDVSFTGGTKYDWSFNMNNGKITVHKDGTKVFSKSGFPSGEYVWFVMNENDSDTSAQETHLLDKLVIMK